MLLSDLVTPRHLTRSAVVYIRQSTPQQVVSNQESRRLQYALKQRALDLGWQGDDVVIIDSDLGISGASATGRDGFKDLAARVSLGQVGIISVHGGYPAVAQLLRLVSVARCLRLHELPHR